MGRYGPRAPERVRKPDPTSLTLTLARRLIQAAVGPRGRMWRVTDPAGAVTFEIGLDKQPGRWVMASGSTPAAAMEAAFGKPGKAVKDPAAENSDLKALETTTPTDPSLPPTPEEIVVPTPANE